MIFHSFDFLTFLAVVFGLYWIVPWKSFQNLLLLAGSYYFYGYVHPWFCLLLAISTLVDYFAGLGMRRFPERKKSLLVLSLCSNLGMLAGFKYFNFFTENVVEVLRLMGFNPHPVTLQVILPVGISFYTFQTLSYTIDIYKGHLEPRKNFIDFALFVSFFPQLVAGPIERATRLLPQVEDPRRWQWHYFLTAWPLIVRGYLKKLVIADNVSTYADKVFTLDHPSLLLLLAGTLAFTAQIYADFSGYTDIARGTARLLGFDLMENFLSPYLAISPSDFWRRWHVSLSTWIRDYLYIPLGGSQVGGLAGLFAVQMTTMGLAGFWHGAAWNYILWGLYHGFLLFLYHALGMKGRWRPQAKATTFLAWAVMFGFTVFGWLLFRTPSMTWLAGVFSHFSWGLAGDSLTVAGVILALLAFYTLPLYLLLLLEQAFPRQKWLQAIYYGAALAAVMVFFRDSQQDFIYFQF